MRNLAQVIGTLIACLPAVQYGQLFYREMETIKILALHKRYDYNQRVHLSEDARKELQWWLDEGLDSNKPLTRDRPVGIIKSDSTGYAWGAVMKDEVTHGMWSDEEKTEHINVLELKAAMLGVLSLCRDLHDCHIRIELDNTTAVSYINNMGGTHSFKCNQLNRQLILWCKFKRIWLSACHIAGKANVSADRYSRKRSIHTEWSLNVETFQALCERFGTPLIDLFASHTNHQLPRYMSLYHDPYAAAINAFYQPWDEYVYIFPPFNLIPRVLKKLLDDKTEKALVVVPLCKTQTWFPKIERMALDTPLHLKPSKTLLTLPSDKAAIHPLYPKLSLMAFVLSGRR